MRVRTLVATTDTAYTRHISEYISEYHADTMEISICNTAEQLQSILKAGKFNVALMDAPLIERADLGAIDLPILLWTGSADEFSAPTIRRIKKHRRISSIVAEVLEQYAAVSGNVRVSGEPEGCITAVWSPCGGVGKTTVALAYAASKASEDKQVFYLNLESFAATSVFLNSQCKSISAVYEMLENEDGNVRVLVQGICGLEDGIRYLGAPDNFDDVCILSPENIRELVSCCAETTDELIIDLSCVCDSRTRQVFELAGKVLLVTDCTDTSKTKLAQFVSQSNVYEGIRDKVVPVVNKRNELTAADSGVGRDFPGAERVVSLPLIDATDAVYVYKTLARCWQDAGSGKR